MQIRVLPADLDTWLARRVTPPRSTGVHVSTVIVAMLKDLAPKKYAAYGTGGDERKAVYEVGYVWEDIIAEALSHQVRVSHHEILMGEQRELLRDGVYGTLDRVLMDEAGFIVEETKATFKKYTADLTDPKYAYWVMQVKTYCAMIGALRARIRALFLGEFTMKDAHGQPVIAHPACWEIAFTPGELDEWWRRFLIYAAQIAETQRREEMDGA